MKQYATEIHYINNPCASSTITEMERKGYKLIKMKVGKNRTRLVFVEKVAHKEKEEE